MLEASKWEFYNIEFWNIAESKAKPKPKHKTTEQTEDKQMYGKVTVYFKNRRFGFIQGQDGNSYFIHASKLNGEYIEKGYYISFDTFSNEKGKYNAKNVIVVETPESKGCQKCGKKKSHRKGKPCNADRLAVDDRTFMRFVRSFMNEQRRIKREVGNGSKNQQYEGITEGITADNGKFGR